MCLIKGKYLLQCFAKSEVWE